MKQHADVGRTPFMDKRNFTHRGPFFLRSRQRGLTIVELMVAIALGLVLMAGLIQVFVSSKQTYRVQDAAARLQENGRFALDFLNAELRTAGFFGCGNFYRLNPRIIANPTVQFSSNTVTTSYDGSSGSWTPTLPAALTALTYPPTVNTDVLTVQRGDDCARYLNAKMSDEAADIVLAGSNVCGFVPGEALIITDCRFADVFRATGVTSAANTTIKHQTTSNTSPNLSDAYNTSAFVTRLRSRTYYIAPGASGQSSLWVFDGANANELVEGVQDMQVTYGEDTTGDRTADRYVTPTAPGFDPDRVMSIRVNLLLVSDEQNLTAQAQALAWDGGTYTPPNGSIGRIFSTSVDLRNKTLDY